MRKVTEWLKVGVARKGALSGEGRTQVRILPFLPHSKTLFKVVSRVLPGHPANLVDVADWMQAVKIDFGNTIRHCS